MKVILHSSNSHVFDNLVIIEDRSSTLIKQAGEKHQIWRCSHGNCVKIDKFQANVQLVQKSSDTEI